MKIFKPNFLAVLFSVKIKSFEFRLYDYDCLFILNKQSTVIKYSEINSFEEAKQTIWTTLSIKLESGLIIQLPGLNESKISVLKESIQKKKLEISKLLTEVKLLEPHVRYLANWCLSAQKGEFFISEYEKNKQLLESEKIVFLFNGHLQKILEPNHINDLNQVNLFYLSPDKFKDQANNTFTIVEIEKFRGYLDTVEKNPLTFEQREAVVSDENSTLVVASAGSGKTSLLVGKVGYLVKKGLAEPSEILILAFNKSAKEEIAARILKQTGIECQCHTFHSFGLSVVAISQDKKPSLASFIENDFSYRAFINNLCEKLLKDPKFSKEITSFFISFLRPYKDAFDFKTSGEYFEYIRANRLITLKGEVVKSYEELEIANYLFTQGINYEYEKAYEFDTATIQKRQYKPDFYLNDYDIYLEHFALSKNNQTPPFINKEEYLASREWKLQLHRDNQTKLIQTFSYEKREGKLAELLRIKLESHHVHFNPISEEELFHELKGQGAVSEFAQLVGTFLNLFKGRGLTQDSYEKLLNPNAPEFPRILSFSKLFKDIYIQYESELHSIGEIDFHDMINLATNHIRSATYKSNFKYILVDEFQDISYGRANLIQALQESYIGAKLFAVGDDWQSIYRFTGSDISLMTEFEKNFGFTKKLFLTQTFRFNSSVEKVTSQFIQANVSQLPKSIKTLTQVDYPSVILFKPNKDSGKFLESLAKEISDKNKGKRVNVLFLGRNNFSENNINWSDLKSIASNCTFEFRTVHRAKGYEADYVIVLDLKKDRSGFPNEIVDDQIINTLLSKPEAFINAEERRLFYVALTRTKNSVYLIADPHKPSDFFNELMEGYFVEKRNIGHEHNRFCPKCKSSHMLERQGKYGLFFGCENYPLCDFVTNSCKSCGIGFFQDKGEFYLCDNSKCLSKHPKCPECESGMLIEKKGKYGLFYGCSNYFNEECNYTSKII
jgi:DNA helicase-4